MSWGKAVRSEIGFLPNDRARSLGPWGGTSKVNEGPKRKGGVRWGRITVSFWKQISSRGGPSIQKRRGSRAVHSSVSNRETQRGPRELTVFHRNNQDRPGLSGDSITHEYPHNTKGKSEGVGT